MGGSSSRVTMNPNMPSPGDSSKKSILSDPLDGLNFTDEQFWKYLGELKREPIPLPSWAKLLGVHIAKHEITDLDDGSFLVKDVIGGYYGTEVDVNFKHSYDPDTNTWTQVCDRDPALQRVPVTLRYRLHSEPQRLIEAWCVNEFAVNSGVQVSAMIEAVLGYLLDAAGTPKDGIIVKAEQPSLDGSGRLVAQSGELDAFLSPDAFTEGVEKMIRDGHGTPNMTGIEITEIDELSFKSKETVTTDGVEFVLWAIHSHEGDVGKAEYFEDDTYTGMTHAYVTKAYRSPFRLETWVESYDKRHAGEEVLKAVKSQAEGILEKIAKEPPAQE
ncbi:unnamed protein product [Polarella glacialis]|uniref:Uncharacterized protein n=1 Tax=Polarella glacialis TaxID=89957 RepID=A0A813LJP5_POLGL|nr:unnamed protein product [Polarella glacialis]